MIAIGGQIGYFTGDPLRLLEDAQILKPTVVPSVPRVLNRIYQAAMTGGNVPGIKGKLFRTAVSTKLEGYYKTGEVKHALWDRLVFRKVCRTESFAFEQANGIYRYKQFLEGEWNYCRRVLPL